MRNIDKIKQKLGSFFKTDKVNDNFLTDEEKRLGYGSSDYIGLDYDRGNKKQEYLYELRGWVASCVTVIADEIAKISPKLYEYKNNEVEEIIDDPILDVLYKVNDYTTYFDHMWLSQVYLELSGECYWWLEYEGTDIKNIFTLRPDRMTIVFDKNELIGYRYRVNGKDINLKKEEIVFLKYPSPLNQFKGYGTLQMAARTVDIDNKSEEWNDRFFDNSARPDSILNIKTQQMSIEQKEQLKKSLKEQYGGLKKAHNTMVLFGEMDLKPFTSSHKDMEFLEQSKFSRDKVLSIFRVPKTIIALTDGVNFANAKSAQFTFAKYCIDPKNERIYQQLNEMLIPLFPNSENKFLHYDNIVPEDTELQLKVYDNGLKNGWLTINEVRRKEGYPDVEGGDVIRIGTIELNGKTEEDKTKRFEKRIKQLKSRNRNYFEIQTKIKDIQTKIKELLKQEITKKIKENKQTISKEDSLKFWKKKDAINDKYIPLIEKKYKRLLKDQQKRILVKLNKAKKRIIIGAIKRKALVDDVQLDKDIEIKESLKIFTPDFEQIFKLGGDEAFALLGLDRVIDLDDKEIQKIIELDTRKFAESATQTTNDKIKESIKTSEKLGETDSELRARVKNLFVEMEDYRSTRIANTEVNRYNNNSSLYAYEESGVVTGKKWFINPGACPVCIPLDGKTIELKKDFFKKGDTHTTSDGKPFDVDYENISAPPMHVNCRCTLIPIFREFEKTVEPIETKYTIVKSLEGEKEYKEKVKKLDSLIEKQEELIEKLNSKTNKKNTELKKINDEKKRLKKIREDLINEYNNQADNQ